MRLFVLDRDEDETGVSGCGVVAEGVEFGDGTVALRRRPTVFAEQARGVTATSTAVWACIADVETIHGHGGRTRVVWLDGAP